MEIKEKEGCESCDKEAEVDALVDGEYKKLCKRCAAMEGAVIVEKPSLIQIDESYKRPKVRDVLLSMAGLSKPKLRKKEATLEDLRRVQKEKLEEEKELKETISSFNVEKKEEEKPWSKWLFRQKSGEEKEIDFKSKNIKIGDLKTVEEDEEVLDI